MEYGYRLLRHVVRQVFGNLGDAARLTAVPIFGPQVLLAILGVGLQPATPGQPDAGAGLALVALVLAALGFCWAAVAWHRFVLREDWPRGLLPQWQGSRVMGYLGRVVLIALVVIGVAVAVLIAVGVVIATTQSPGIAQLMGFGLVFGGSWVWTRFALVLPARSVDAQMRLGDSWRLTAPVSGEIFVPILVFTILGSLVPGFIGLTLGATLVTDLILAAISWVFVLLNLALLTTLYGNLVEGREIA